LLKKQSSRKANSRNRFASEPQKNCENKNTEKNKCKSST